MIEVKHPIGSIAPTLLADISGIAGHLLIQLNGFAYRTRPPPAMLDARQITQLHDQATLRWHQEDARPDLHPSMQLEDSDPLLHMAAAQHLANFNLWHEEDKAREPDVSDAHITEVKHAIDAFNQTRNDLVEEMDRILLDTAGTQNPDAPLQSESPGLIIDRLSILALKIYHTAEEVHRATASEAHHQKNIDRLALLRAQRNDLAACLDQLWNEVLQGKRRFKLYRQMKMYNDPDLNPMVYAHKATAKSS